MPSLQDSIKQVRESMEKKEEPDHDVILASLDAEIGKHNANMAGLKYTMEETRRSSSERDTLPLRFRFKERSEDSSRKPKRRQDRSGQGLKYIYSSKRRRQERKPASQDSQEADGGTEHPFPRESAPQDLNTEDSFRESLFDALADDEGATFWEGVYSQPIHIYPRPSTQTPQGELEQMSDEEYVTYVKRKMWEKNHPEIVYERERAQMLVEEEARRKKTEKLKFERQRWKEHNRRKAGGPWSDHEGAYAEKSLKDVSSDLETEPRTSKRNSEMWQKAWSKYLGDWIELKARVTSNSDIQLPIITLPWPLLGSKPLEKPNIEGFFKHAPTDAGHSRLQLLKAERVRWHPDKIQHRFGERVDAELLKKVTGVFQVVDGLVEAERKKSGN